MRSTGRIATIKTAEKVSDVAKFFASENLSSAKDRAKKCCADHSLAVSQDLSKYYSEYQGKT